MVKSPPELWAELSEVEGLARHLGEFGEIKITRVEHENTVAWEGENASGTVQLEPTGWGTKVTITAAVTAAEAEPEDQAVTLESESEPMATESDPGPFDPDPDPFDPEPVAEPKVRGFFARWLFRERRDTTPAHPTHRLSEFPEAPEPQMPAWRASEFPPPPEPEPVAGLDPTDDHEDFEFDFLIRRGGEKPEPEVAPLAPIAPDRAREVLETALENLGQAHHRPFSRG